ncbi:MAG: flagellar biosynthesis regulator FlaF [Actinomycetota bacterium]
MPSDTRGYDASTGYNAVPQPGNPAQTEAWALVEAARRIHAASQSPDSIEALKDALRLNWRLWTLFQANLSLEECNVPDDLRQNMLNLCNFVDRQSVEALINPNPTKVQVFIDINRNIANGLLASAELAAKAAAEQPAEAKAEAGSMLDIQSA